LERIQAGGHLVSRGLGHQTPDDLPALAGSNAAFGKLHKLIPGDGL